MVQSPKFLILGAGGHGKVLADVIRSAGHKVVGFVDQDVDKIGQIAEPGGATILYAQDAWAAGLGDVRRDAEWSAIAFGIGNNRVRLRLLDEFKGVDAPPVIAASAIVSASAIIGAGTVVFPGAIINSNAQIGRGVIINSGAVIEHDCVIEDGAHISPNATLAGGVTVGKLSWVGAGSVVIQQYSIGEDAIIGAGAVVIRDIPARATAVGNPAKVIKQG